jgi:nitrite reductase/ring-hydroxylating ferredoxin subunit
MPLIDATRTSEIPVGSMKYVEVQGKEILLANVAGKFYATDNRCGHMNGPLSMGTLQGNVVECSLHHARFDVTTGKTLREGHLGGVSHAVMSTTRSGCIMDMIKTHDLKTYEVLVEGDIIKIRID